MASAPQLLSTNVQDIVNEMVTYYQSLNPGRILLPSDPEMQLILTFAYREGILRMAHNEAAVQQLVDFAEAPMLDYLGALLGVTRLAEMPATVLIQFTLVNGHTGVTVPAGTRVATIDGKAVFSTTQPVSAAIGVYTVSVECECTESGTIGNGYTVGNINNVLDPQPYIVANPNGAVNITASAGGADTETDDLLRERIKLASDTFSVAGSEGSYRYFALSANPGIIWVEVDSPSPGEVLLLPLMADGTITPTQIINDVLAICSAEENRPLTDLVLCQAPTQIPYVLNVELILLNGAVAADEIAAVQAALDEFVVERRQRTGLDVIDTAIKAKAKIGQVYDINLPGWANLVLTRLQYGFCTAINISVTNFVDG